MMGKKLIVLVVVLGLAIRFAASAEGVPAQALEQADLTNQVRKALLTLPYYGVFDNLEFSIKEGTVELNGQVVRPVTKQDAESRVKKLKGVETVVNNIKVLPLSTTDNQLRRVLYRAIFRAGGLYRYRLGTNPSIHIIVDNGQVTLIGVVDNEGDKTLAGIKANTVSGVFSVDNNLRVEGKNK